MKTERRVGLESKTGKEQGDWDDLVKRLDEAVQARFAPLEHAGFSRCGLRHQWIADIRDHTLCFRYTRSKLAVDFQVAAVSLYLGVVLFHFSECATCDPLVKPVSGVDLELELEKRARDRLLVPSWLRYPTLREAGLKSRRSRYARIVKERTDDCVALLATRLVSFGHFVDPEFPVPEQFEKP